MAFELPGVRFDSGLRRFDRRCIPVSKPRRRSFELGNRGFTGTCPITVSASRVPSGVKER